MDSHLVRRDFVASTRAGLNPLPNYSSTATTRLDPSTTWLVVCEDDANVYDAGKYVQMSDVGTRGDRLSGQREAT